MKFSIQHQRSVVGNDISVAVDGEGDQVISHVTTTLDGFDIGDDELDPPCASYERKFLQAGDASPHLEHELLVTARDSVGKTISADRRWEDLN
jgi:hypothetical protein